MKHETFTCDRCGKALASGEYHWHGIVVSPGIEIDLCRACATSMNRTFDTWWVDGKRTAPPAPAPKPL